MFAYRNSILKIDVSLYQDTFVLFWDDYSVFLLDIYVRLAKKQQAPILQEERLYYDSLGIHNENLRTTSRSRSTWIRLEMKNEFVNT